MLRTHKLHTFCNRLLALALFIVGAVMPARAQGYQRPLPRPDTCAAPAPGMVAWWTGDSTTRDIKGGNDGNLDGGAGYAIGKVGGAFDFDGRTGFMSAPSRGLPVGDAPRTVETWVYTKSESWARNRHTIFEYGVGGFRQAFGIDMENYPQIEVYTWSDDLTVDTQAPEEGWLHIAVTYDETRTLRVYVNGIMRGIRQYPDGIDTVPSKVNIGGSAALGGATYAGYIDEVSVYDRALSADEVGSIYRAGDSGKCRYSVSGRVTDSCGDAMEDVTVDVTISGQSLPGKFTRSITTGPGGNYVFSSLPAGGDYVITPRVPANQRGDFAPPFSAFVNLSANQTADFFFRPFRMAIPCPSTFDYISDMDWVGIPINAYQVVHRDRSVGDFTGHPGNPITLNGIVYRKGLGVHAHSVVTYDLGGRYSSFISDVGVDDETRGAGSVRFFVVADGVTLYDSGDMYGNSPTQPVNVNVEGRQVLELVVTNADNGDSSDHADWADARLVRR